MHATETSPKKHVFHSTRVSESPILKAESSAENRSDDKLMALAEQLFANEKVLDAKRLLQKIKDLSIMSEKHRNMLKVAEECESAISDLIGEPGSEASGWKKQGESHGRLNTLVYYKIDDNEARLTCRVETPIESSLLIPLLSVLNESDLYDTWVPSWTRPCTIGVKSSQELQRVGRNQIIQIVGDVPWPFSTREVIMQTIIVDDIDTNGYFAARLHSLHNDAGGGGSVVPPKPPNVERIDFEGALLFRPCPADHPALQNSKSVYDEPMILVTFKMFCDPNMQGVPTWLINFVTRTVIGQIWGMLLQVAEDVKAGDRPRHKEAIESKPDFYDFVQERVSSMFQRLKEEVDDYEELRFISYLQS